MKTAILGFVCLSTLVPAVAVTTDGAMWQAADAEDAGFVTLEEIRSFYKLMPLPRPRGSATRSVGNGALTLEFGPNPRDLKIHGLHFTLTHPVRTDEKGELLVSKTDLVKLIDPVLRPTYIPNRRAVKTVILDPGHGGHDAGTVTEHVREADAVLLLAGNLANELKKRGFQVKLTREINRYLSEQARVDSIGDAEDAIFISLHLNSGRSDVSGIQTYTLQPSAPGKDGRPANEFDAMNTALAVSLQASLLDKTKAQDGGCRRVHYSLLSSVKCPAAHVELGYATNTKEAQALNSDEYRNLLVTALADGISVFSATMNPENQLKALPPPPPPPPEPVKVEPPKKKAEPPAKKKSTPRRRKPAQRSKPAERSKPATRRNRK